MVAAVTAALVVGPAVVVAPVPAFTGFLLLGAAIFTWTRPATAVVACIVTASLHRGLFLYLRVETGNYPLSVFDVLPPLLLLASVSLASRGRHPAPPTRAPLAVCTAMIFAGLVMGVIIGASEAAAYEMVRVLRLEGWILCVLVCAIVAGHLPQWRKAVATGLLGAGLCVAAQLLVSFGWSLATGTYFWSLFPFGRSVGNLAGNIQSGNVLTLRENAVSGFLILPALSLLILRFSGRDFAMLMFLVAGGLAWLSRGLWVAMCLMLIIALAHRVASGRLSGAKLTRIVIPVVAAVCTLLLASGDILGQRIGETTNLRGDVSFDVRRLETEAALEALAEGPGSMVFGLGSGVVVDFPRTSAFGKRSALLENSVLGLWTNTGLLGLLGVTLLFFGAALRGWRLASDRDHPDRAVLGSMSLALPVLWLQGFIGGTFTVPEPAILLFLLAGTALATPLATEYRCRTGASEPSSTK